MPEPTPPIEVTRAHLVLMQWEKITDARVRAAETGLPVLYQEMDRILYTEPQANSNTMPGFVQRVVLEGDDEACIILDGWSNQRLGEGQFRVPLGVPLDHIRPVAPNA